MEPFHFNHVNFVPDQPIDLNGLTKGQLLTILDLMGMKFLRDYTREVFDITGKILPNPVEIIAQLRRMDSVPVFHCVAKIEKALAKCDAFLVSPHAITIMKDTSTQSFTSINGFFGTASDNVNRMASALADVVTSINKPVVITKDQRNVCVQTSTAQNIFPPVDFGLTADGCLRKLYERAAGSMDSFRDGLAGAIAADSTINPALASKLAQAHSVFKCASTTGKFVESDEARMYGYTHQFTMAMPPRMIDKPCSLEYAWRNLDAHRKIRGADRKGISPILRGYNYGALPNGSQDPFEIVLGVNHMLKSLKFDGICFQPNLKYNATVWELLSLNFPVLYGDADYIDYFQGCPPGRYRLNDDAKNICSLFWVNKDRKPGISKESINFSDQNRSQLIDAKISINTVFLTHATPSLSRLKEGFLFPTNHPHALDVYVVSKLRLDANVITLDDIAIRAVNANLFKTSFAFHRVPFVNNDAWRISADSIKGRNSKKNCDEIKFDIHLGDGDGDFEGAYETMKKRYEKAVSTAEFDLSQKKIINFGVKTQSEMPVKTTTTVTTTTTQSVDHLRNNSVASENFGSNADFL